MRTVFKYKIWINDSFSVVIPRNAIFRHAGIDPTGEPAMWYEVDTTNASEKITFHIAGTGRPVQFEWTFLATFIDGPFVWHLYRA